MLRIISILSLAILQGCATTNISDFYINGTKTSLNRPTVYIHKRGPIIWSNSTQDEFSILKLIHTRTSIDEPLSNTIKDAISASDISKAMLNGMTASSYLSSASNLQILKETDQNAEFNSWFSDSLVTDLPAQAINSNSFVIDYGFRELLINENTQTGASLSINAGIRIIDASNGVVLTKETFIEKLYLGEQFNKFPKETQLSTVKTKLLNSTFVMGQRAINQLVKATD